MIARISFLAIKTSTVITLIKIIKTFHIILVNDNKQSANINIVLSTYIIILIYPT